MSPKRESRYLSRRPARRIATLSRMTSSAAANCLQNAIGCASFAPRQAEEPMGKIVYSMLTSLDGFIEGPSGDIGLPVPEEELHRHFNDEMRRTAIALCGRRMYEEMRFWDSPE